MQGDLEAVHRAWQADHEEQPPDSVYAFPKQKKESMTDPSHVRNGLPGFDQVQGVSDADRDLAFANIEATQSINAVLSSGLS